MIAMENYNRYGVNPGKLFIFYASGLLFMAKELPICKNFIIPGYLSLASH